jgi:hypothetical protein
MNLSSGAALGRDNCGLIAESLSFGGVETGALGFLGGFMDKPLVLRDPAVMYRKFLR